MQREFSKSKLIEKLNNFLIQLSNKKIRKNVMLFSLFLFFFINILHPKKIELKKDNSYAIIFSFYICKFILDLYHLFYLLRQK